MNFDITKENIVISGDIMIKFKNNGYYRNLKMFRLALNTGFVENK